MTSSPRHSGLADFLLNRWILSRINIILIRSCAKPAGGGHLGQLGWQQLGRTAWIRSVFVEYDLNVIKLWTVWSHRKRWRSPTLNTEFDHRDCRQLRSKIRFLFQFVADVVNIDSRDLDVILYDDDVDQWTILGWSHCLYSDSFFEWWRKHRNSVGCFELARKWAPASNVEYVHPSSVKIQPSMKSTLPARFVYPIDLLQIEISSWSLKTSHRTRWWWFHN